MNSSRLLIATDEKAAIEGAARPVIQAASEAVKARGAFTWALSGGTTPERLYERLADAYFRDRLPWRDIEIFFGDERCVPPDHPESNYRMAKAALLSRVPINPERIHRMPGEQSPPIEAARAYDAQLRSHFRLEKAIPRFDLIMLGVGTDGHTASLFPGSEALHETDRWVVSALKPGLSQSRLTLTLPLINEARNILVLATGEGKSPILSEVLNPDREKGRYPIDRVTPREGVLTWLIDRPAASQLPAAARVNAKAV